MRDFGNDQQRESIIPAASAWSERYPAGNRGTPGRGHGYPLQHTEKQKSHSFGERAARYLGCGYMEYSG